jgi:hypothetical protein
MRFVILTAGLTLALVGPLQAEAQTDNSAVPDPARAAPTASSGLRPAPVGHRQPTVDSVEKARADKRSTSKSQQRGSDLDKNLIICRGC